MTPRAETPSRAEERSPRSAAAAVGLAIALLAIVFVAAGVLIAVSGRDEAPKRPAKTIEIVVPAGTQDRLEAGEKVVVMPERLEFRVGDTILIENKDSVTQYVGPYTVGPREKVTFTFGAPGNFSGYCPLSEGERYEIVVTP